jgi:dihydroxy-acid dehydratase
MAGHVAPEAPHGGPIAAVRDGDVIEFDIPGRRLELDLPQDEIDRRVAEWEAPPPKYTKGVMAKYARSVSSASEGAITR